MPLGWSFGKVGEQEKYSISNRRPLFQCHSCGRSPKPVNRENTPLVIADPFLVGGNIPVRGLAKLSGSTWSGVGAGTPPWKACDDAEPSTVRAIAWNGSGQMYVTGYLANQVSSQINHIFLLQDGQWSSTSPTQGISRSTGYGELGHALAVDRFAGKVYVAGLFQTAGTITVANIAVWNDFRTYTLSDIGTLNGGSYSYGLGVNSSPTLGTWAVGYSQVNVTGYGLREHAYYFQGGPYINDMGGLWGAGDNSYANAINDSGTIVGYGDYAGSGTLFRAFRWSGGVFTQLNPIAGGDRGSGLAINSTGDIVGFCRNGSGVDRATSWIGGSPSGNDLQSLFSSAQQYASYAYAINKDGYYVGKSKYDSANTYFHAYRANPWPKLISDRATHIDLGTLGGNESIAYAINDSRQIVGAAQDNLQNWRAFLAAPDSTSITRDLGPGYAYAINNFGQVVGYSGSYAFIWDNSVSAYQNLNNLIPAGSGFTLTHAEAINDKGQIVGWGTKTIGQGYQIHGFQLDP